MDTERRGSVLQKNEKSCGALVIKQSDGIFYLLVLKHKFSENWSFPKGHVESGETEVQTALREVREETGLKIDLIDGFKERVVYYPKPNIRKQVVYFLGSVDENAGIRCQEEEIQEIKWVRLDSAQRIVKFRNDKRLIERAQKIVFSGSIFKSV